MLIFLQNSDPLLMRVLSGYGHFAQHVRLEAGFYAF